MKNKYNITFKGNNQSINVLVGYNEDGTLHSAKFDEQTIPPNALQFIWERIPLQEMSLGDIGMLAIVSPVPKDLSFNAFWEAYDYKVGDKQRAYKLWTALGEADRTLALRAIPKYNVFLKLKPNQDRLYPETFLKQERFRSEFKF